jgi:hypothetical protein
MSIDTITTDLTEAERLGLDLWQRWTALWNGDLALADELLSPGFRIHFGNAVVSVDTDALRGPGDLVAFIAEHRAQLPGVRYEPDGPPIVAFEVGDGVPTGRLAARWTVRRTDGTGRAGPQERHRRARRHRRPDHRRVVGDRRPPFRLTATDPR